MSSLKIIGGIFVTVLRIGYYIGADLPHGGKKEAGRPTVFLSGCIGIYIATSCDSSGKVFYRVLIKDLRT